jgi:riboflavin kinase/FMN adenylyltransferase
MFAVMKVITDIYKFNPLPCAATVGSFDGVHLGHCSMLKELRVKAAERGLPVMVVTFARHPRLLLGTVNEPFLLSTNEEKIALLESLGVDYCVLLDFDASMASMTAERFMGEVLAKQLGVKLLCVGYDHRFGKPQAGEGFEQYAEYGKALGMELFKALPYVAGDVAVSSSKVRRALAGGDIALANSLLGHDYSFAGTVVHGAGIGRSLGFPTANILLHDDMKLLPADGVYDVSVSCMGSNYKGVMNIGVKPTIGENLVRTVEVHVIGFSGDIYDKEIVVFPVRRLRGEMGFESVDALRRQIEADVELVKRGI